MKSSSILGFLALCFLKIQHKWDGLLLVNVVRIQPCWISPCERIHIWNFKSWCDRVFRLEEGLFMCFSVGRDMKLFPFISQNLCILCRKLLSACVFPALLCVRFHLSIRVVLVGFLTPLALQDELLSDLFSSLWSHSSITSQHSLCTLFTIWHLHPGGVSYHAFFFFCLSWPSQRFNSHPLTALSVCRWISHTHLWVSCSFLNTKRMWAQCLLYTKAISLQTSKDAALLFNLCMITVM